MSTSNFVSQNHVSNKKRGRDDTELKPSSTEPKRVNSVPEKDSTELINPDEVDQIPSDIMDILNNSDIVHDSPSQDLDSVIRSFEEEILQLTSPPNPSHISDSGESQPDLGYLLGASDDDLGLPPTTNTTTTTSSPDEKEPKDNPIDSTVDANAIEMGSMIEFDENELLSYDSFELGLSEAPKVVDENGFETVGGLFDSPEGLTWQI